MKSFKLDELLAAYELEGITLIELIHTLNDCRTSAQLYNRTGEEVGPDHALRLKAVEMLSKLAQVPFLGKEQAKKKSKEDEPTNFSALLEASRAQGSALPAPSKLQ